jgi:endoglucanase
MVFAAESFWLSPSRLCGRALDNKVGCFILTQVLRELSKDEDLGVDLIGTFTTQEEVNLCGSQFLSNLIDPSPDYTIVVDVGASTDHPGVNEKKFGTQTLGGGPFIDVGPNDNEVLVKQLISCAETKGIPLQPNHAASGSTNMTSYFNKGIPGVSVGVVGRYLHTAVTCIDRADIEACVRLLVEFLRSKGAVDSARLFHPMLRRWTDPPIKRL